jgi:PmbA protein
VAELDRDDRLALCEAAQQAISGADGLISATSGTSDGHVVEAMVSSNGFEGVQENTYLWTGSEVTLRDAGDKKPANWYWGGACRRSDVPDAATTAKEALERTARMLGAEKGPTKKTVMVVDARSAGSLLRRLLSGASGRAVQQDQSFWAGQLGQQLFSERLTLIDDPLLVRGLGSRLFDGEGIAAKPLPLVEKGVLRNYYLDTYYAKKLGVAPTTGGNSNIVVELGDRGLDELLADADGGIYVDAWLGGNADTTTGDFSMGCRGRLIEGGTLGAPVTEMNITGNLADLFARLEAVGNDPYPYSSLRAPTLVFGDVQFAGV